MELLGSISNQASKLILKPQIHRRKSLTAETYCIIILRLVCTEVRFDVHFGTQQWSLNLCTRSCRYCACLIVHRWIAHKPK